MEKFFLIIDIKTSLLIVNPKAIVDEINNWPDIIEIGWQLYDKNQVLLNEESFKIKPLCEIISDIQKNNDYVDKNYIPFFSAIDKLIEKLKQFKPVIVAHNCDFNSNVIQANLIKNKIDFNITDFEKICTMKESTAFCNLPDLKYPNLIELYEILFNSKPEISNRVIFDVRATAKSFFKLIELEIIDINKYNKIISNDLDKINDINISKAIDTYISDINNFSIFYDHKNIKQLFKEEFKNSIKERYNKDYQPDIAELFKIPYNRIIDRDVIALKLEDIIIRYIITDYIKEKTNFFLKKDNFDDNIINNISQHEIQRGNPIMVIIDIYNFYESINHNKLLKEIMTKLHLQANSVFINVLKKSLSVLYSVSFDDHFGCIYKKEMGLLLGSIPDKYLAEFYLNNIEKEIKTFGIPIYRIGDEFIFYAENIKTSRILYNKINTIISDYDLLINKSKTIVKDFRKDNLKLNYDIGWIDSQWMNNGSEYPYKISEPKFELIDLNENKNINKKYLHNSIYNNYGPFKDYNDDTEESINSEIEDNKIDSYESSIIFLKYLVNSQKEIITFQEKYPNCYYNFERDSSELYDYQLLDKGLFREINIKKLKKIIFSYPKSEYCISMAINLLVFAARNLTHFSSIEYGLDSPQYYITRTCEIANLTIIDILISEDIHPYQKYILLRTLFKNKEDVFLDIDNYNIPQVNHPNYSMGEYDLEPTLPFIDKVYEIVKELSIETKNYPLKIICNELQTVYYDYFMRSSFL